MYRGGAVVAVLAFCVYNGAKLHIFSDYTVVFMKMNSGIYCCFCLVLHFFVTFFHQLAYYDYFCTVK